MEMIYLFQHCKSPRRPTEHYTRRKNHRVHIAYEHSSTARLLSQVTVVKFRRSF